MTDIDTIGLEAFLKDYPEMAIRPSLGVDLRLKGNFAFTATHPIHGQVTDAFNLQIDVPADFPRELPLVTDVGGRIPRTGEFHINADGSLCLGSQLRLLLKVGQSPTLSGFAHRCLVPYLFAISQKLSGGGPLVFGELAHYGPGLLNDYAQLFGVATNEAAYYTLKLLAKKKRIANKLPCPCGCKRRLGRCRFNRRLNRYRTLASRSWFKRQLKLAAQVR